MKVILFGGSGMVGQGVLRECLLDPGVEDVLIVACGVDAYSLRSHTYRGFSAAHRDVTAMLRSK